MSTTTGTRRLTGCPNGCPKGLHICGVGDPIRKPSVCTSGCLARTGYDQAVADAFAGRCRWCGTEWEVS